MCIFFRDKVLAKKLEIRFVPSEDQIAGVFMKALPFRDFVSLMRQANLCNVAISAWLSPNLA